VESKNGVILKEDSRTPEFYEFMRSSGSSKADIEKFRHRLSKSPLDDTLTNYFVHEARNAIQPLIFEGEDGELLLTWTPKEYEDGRRVMMNVRRGLNWFKDEGFLPKEEIRIFLDEIEQMGEWNSQTVSLVDNKFRELTEQRIKDYENS
jgi:hypothetical protein